MSLKGLARRVSAAGQFIIACWTRSSQRCLLNKRANFGSGTLAMTTIYKICTATEWHEAEHAGVYRGSVVDRRDGVIHFSTAEQSAETATKWVSGQHDLVPFAVRANGLGVRLY